MPKKSIKMVSRLVQRMCTLDVIIAVVLGLLFFIIGIVFAPLGIDPHQGFMFKPALDVRNGFVLFKETFHWYGALTAYIQAFALLLFGGSVWSINFITIIFYSATLMLLYALWRSFLPADIAAVCGILCLVLAPFLTPFHAFLPWSSVYALFFVCAGGVAMFRFIDTGRRRYLFLAGACASLAFWCRQPNGILLFAVFILFLSIRNLRIADYRALLFDNVVLASGFCGVFAPFIIWFFLADMIRDWWIQSVELVVIWNRIFGKSIRYLLFCLFVPAHGKIWVIMPVTSMSVCAWSLIRYLRAPSAGCCIQKIFLYSLICLASWHQYYPITCTMHVYWAAMPMLGLFAFPFWADAKRLLPAQHRIWPHIAALCLLALVFSGIAVNRITWIRAKIGRRYEKISEPFFYRGMRTTVEKKESLQALNAFFKAHAGYCGECGIVCSPSVDRALGSFMTYSRNRDYGIRLLFLNWNGVENYGLYPSREREIASYIERALPCVVQSMDDTASYDTYTSAFQSEALGIRVLLPSVAVTQDRP